MSLSFAAQLSSSSPRIAGKRVLVIGHRQPIANVLIRLGIPFAVWHDKPIKRPPGCLKTCCSFFPSTAKDIRRFVDQEFAELGPFSDVIAGTETSVYIASVCRRALNARKSKDSIALTCHDKQLMKSRMKAAGVPMTDYITQTESESPQLVYDQLGPKVVIKQRKNSGGRGVTIADSVDGITARNERGLIYERFVDAHEMSVETFVHRGKIQFTSTTNYLIKSHANIVPANVPANVLEKVMAINRQVLETLRLNWGLTHAEYYWTDENVLFGEVALRPPGGYIMECISLAHELDAWEAFVANELDLPYEFPVKCNRSAGAVLLHAGQGQLLAVHNTDAVKQLPSCKRFRLLVKPGDTVKSRAGVSDVSAYGHFMSELAETTQSDMLTCFDLVRFEMKDPVDTST